MESTHDLKEPVTAPTEADINAYLEEHVRVVDQPVRHTHLFEDATTIVKAIFTKWSEQDIKLVQCKDGITNKLIRCTHIPSQTNVLIRSYGRRSEVIIDRKQEITVR